MVMVNSIRGKNTQCSSLNKLNYIETVIVSPGNVADLSETYLGDELCFEVMRMLKQSNKNNLNLRGNHIHADGAAILSEMLKINDSLRELSLEWNAIGIFNHGVAALGRALELNTTLLHLDIRNNSIQPDGATHLANALKSNKTLLTIDIRWNDIGSLGGKAFSESLNFNNTLQQLLLTGNNICSHILSTIDEKIDRNRSHIKKLPDGSIKEINLADNENSTMQQLLMEYLSEKKEKELEIMKSHQIVQEQKNEIIELQAQLKALKEQLKESIITVKFLEKQLLQTKENNIKDVELREIAYKSLQEQVVKGCEDLENSEKNCAVFKEKVREWEIQQHRANQERDSEINRLKDDKQAALEESKMLEISWRSTQEELAETRKILQEQREIWKESLRERQQQHDEICRVLEQKCQNIKDDMENKIKCAYENVDSMQESKKKALNESEQARLALVSEKIRSEKHLLDLEKKMEKDAELKLSSNLVVITKELETVKASRDYAQEKIMEQTKTISLMQDDHFKEIKVLEERTEEIKQSESHLKMELQKERQTTHNLVSELRILESKFHQSTSMLLESEKRYDEKDSMNNKLIKEMKQSFNEERKEWQVRLKNKEKLISDSQNELEMEKLATSRNQRAYKETLTGLTNDFIHFINTKLKDAIVDDQQDVLKE